MSWDFRLDRKTGDWVFDGNKDFLGVDGDELIRQRIFIRMKIPRGSFIYDVDRQLGSRAYEALRFTTQRNLRDLPVVVEEALEGMTDISISSVDVSIDDDQKQAQVAITYRHVTNQDTALFPDALGERTTILNLPLTSGALAVDFI